MNRMISAGIALFLWAVLALGTPGTESTRMVVHLLDYIAKDYGGGVQNGKVVSDLEYQEMKDFSKTVVEYGSQLHLQGKEEEAIGLFSQLQNLILNKADAEEVSRVAKAAQGLVFAQSNLQMSPEKWPDLERGGQLYAQNCTQCHGALGFGDGPSGKGLDPSPSNFHAEGMSDTSPFASFNVIRLGVPGTGMAAFSDFSDSEVWDLAFYVNSLRHGGKESVRAVPSEVSLSEVSSLSDNQLLQRVEGASQQEKQQAVRALRLHTVQNMGANYFVSVSRAKLKKSIERYQEGEREAAETLAVAAYLEGIEPIEPNLRSRDSELVSHLESLMLSLRRAISDKNETAIQEKYDLILAALDRTEEVLDEKTNSASFTFLVSSGIFLREGFEAFLVLVTLLSVIRALGVNGAATYVHAGWLSAIGIGVLLWFFSGWVMGFSGAHREVLEGSVCFLAVTVLLYFGFWLHRKTEISRWRQFVEGMAKMAVTKGKLIGISFVAFMAVFREAFETVLFLRALSLETPPEYQWTILAGMLASSVFILGSGYVVLKYSVKLPVRKIFSISAFMLWVLSFVLIGKGIHSFQEAGLISISSLPFNLRMDWVGIYPTYESFLSQLAIVFFGLTFIYLNIRSFRLPRTAL